MRRRRAWKSLRHNGPGRMRIRIASMLAEIGIIVDPQDINVNNTPACRWEDCARWNVNGTRDGAFVHVCSWDRMTDIIRSKGIAVVEDNNLHFEVCGK